MPYLVFYCAHELIKHESILTNCAHDIKCFRDVLTFQEEFKKSVNEVDRDIISMLICLLVVNI